MDSLNGITLATMQLVKDQLAKATTTTGITVGTGLQAYPLEAPAKSLYPVLSPLRNRIPRVPGMGNAWHWKAITAINAGNLSPGVAEGARNSVIQYTEIDYTAAFKTLGLEGSVTQEAEWQARGYDDARARSSLSVLQALMVQEEMVILGGNTTSTGITLGTTPTPTTSASGSGATLPTLTYDVICVALTARGAIYCTTAAVNGTGLNGDKSATATQAITLGQTLFASVAAVRGAFAYAWFVGASGASKCEAITFINSAAFTAALAGTGAAIATITGDNSQNALEFDGLLTQTMKSGSGAYQKTLATGTAGVGTGLTSDSGGGIVEIDAALQSLWDNSRIGIDVLWVNAQENRNITKKVINAGAASLIRMPLTEDGMGNITAGARVGTYYNKFTQQLIPVLTHPFMPKGTIFGAAESLPYPNNDVPNVLAMRVLQDYVDIDFAYTTRKREHGVYFSAVLQNYFPAGTLCITNIADA